MGITETISLIKFVALTLPAIAIYMDVVAKTRQDWIDDINASKTPVDRSQPGKAKELKEETNLGYAYHLGRASIAILSASAILLFLILILQMVGYHVFFLFILAVALVAFALLTFGAGVIFQQVALQDISIHRAYGMVWDHIRAMIFGEDEDK